MNGYLIDSDIAIDVLKGRPRGIETMASLAPLPVSLSAITVGELVHGVEYGPNKDRGRRRLDVYLQTVAILPFDGEIARVYGHIRANLYSEGRRIDDPDLMIAATAIYHDLAFVTENRRHFERIDRLNLARVE